jgi:hypothetical protein
MFLLWFGAHLLFYSVSCSFYTKFLELLRTKFLYKKTLSDCHFREKINACSFMLPFGPKKWSEISPNI